MDESLTRLGKSLSVRIAQGGGNCLIGSGIILVCEMNNYALVFTAAHVLDHIFDNEDTPVHFCFADENNHQHILEVTLKKGECRQSTFGNNIGYVYVHPEYVPHTNANLQNEGAASYLSAKLSCEDAYPRNDAAIICLPFCEWMKGLPKFEICEYDQGAAMIVGFPRDYDKMISKEESFRYENYRGNIFYKEVIVENQHTANLVIKDIAPNYNTLLTTDYSLDGLSGGGILTKNACGLRLHGVLVSDRGEAIKAHYATNSRAFLEIMEHFHINADFPRTMPTILKEAVKRFDPRIDENARLWLLQNTENYLGERLEPLFFQNEYKESGIFPCESNRALCSSYYVNKLIGKVLLGRVYGIDPLKINEQTIYIEGYDDEIHVEHICTEERIEQIVTEIIRKGAFAENGPYYNESIFVVSDRNQEKPIGTITRSRCRRIITSIIDNRYTEWEKNEKFSDKITGLLTEEHRKKKHLGFSIIKGDLEQADIGFVGLGRLEDVMKNTECREDLEDEVKSLMESAWRE